MTERLVPKLPAPLAGSRPLLGFYLIGMAAISIGIVMVLILNLATPFAWNRIVAFAEEMRRAHHLQIPLWLILVLRLILVLVIAYLPILTALHMILRPVDSVIRMLKEGIMPEKPLWDLAGQRLLNLPFRCVPISIGLYIILPAIGFHYFYFTGAMTYQSTLVFSIRSSMVGLIASTIASHRLEHYSRRLFIPIFFPEGGLTDKRGVVSLSIRKRIRLVYLVGSLVPMVILLVTLFTLQWELKNEIITAEDYGRGILIFACVLMAWVLLATSQLNILVSRSITDPLRDIIKVLKKVRRGQFKIKVPVVSNDEIGYTAETINEMTEGLLERDRIRMSLELAQEVQQNLLPQKIPTPVGLEIGAMSEYCDETGGDYYDFVEFSGPQSGAFGIVMGDVAGHGISSALLMASARAFFRQRASQGGCLSAVVSDVNQLLSRDTADSGQFMTLFYIVFDSARRSIQWVRAGHDPGWLYRPVTDTYLELRGPGIPLGVQADWPFDQQRMEGFDQGQMLILGTDGIWEARNPMGAFYGKRRLEELVRRNARRPAQDIVNRVFEDHRSFRGGKAPDDDLTLLIAKAL